MSRSEEPRKRRAEHSPCAAGKQPSPNSSFDRNEASDASVQRLDHGALVVLIDGDTALLLLSAVDGGFKFVVRGRCFLWPLFCASCRVSAVDVSWECANRVGGVAVFSPTSHALQKVSVLPRMETPIDLTSLAQCIRETSASPMGEELEQLLRPITAAEQFTSALLLRRCDNAACDVVTSQAKFEALFTLSRRSLTQQLGFDLEPASQNQPGVLSFKALSEAKAEVLRLCKESELSQGDDDDDLKEEEEV